MADDHNGIIIPVTEWRTIIGSFGKGGVPMPFVQEIFLIECPVAGTTHVDGIEEKTSDIAQGSLLAFRREPDNRYDSLAILILNSKDQKIGYVPRAKNEVLARLMDGGKLLFGRVEDKQAQGDWINIAVKVFMRDL